MLARGQGGLPGKGYIFTSHFLCKTTATARRARASVLFVTAYLASRLQDLHTDILIFQSSMMVIY